MDTLKKIKQAVLEGRVDFSIKALDEMDSCKLDKSDAMEAILNATYIYKTIRSRSPFRRYSQEKLFVIIGLNCAGVEIYTKGKFVKRDEREIFYLMISCKKSE